MTNRVLGTRGWLIVGLREREWLNGNAAKACLILRVLPLFDLSSPCHSEKKEFETKNSIICNKEIVALLSWKFLKENF